MMVFDVLVLLTTHTSFICVGDNLIHVGVNLKKGMGMQMFKKLKRTYCSFVIIIITF